MASFNVFGMRNSGTNYLGSLLKENFPELRIAKRYGWKHGGLGVPWRRPRQLSEAREFAPIHDGSYAPEDHIFFVITREPFSWLQSMHRKPHHAPFASELDFSQFIRMRWQAFFNVNFAGEDFSKNKSERYQVAEVDNDIESYSSIFELRASKNYLFTQMARRVRNVAYIQYESLCADPETVLREVSNCYGIKFGDFQDIASAKHGGGLFAPKTMACVSAVDLDYICSHLDFYAEAKCGYYLDASRLCRLVSSAQRVAGEDLLRCVHSDGHLRLKREGGETMTVQIFA